MIAVVLHQQLAYWGSCSFETGAAELGFVYATALKFADAHSFFRKDTVPTLRSNAMVVPSDRAER